MAKINAGDASRSDMWRIDPSNIVVDHAKNARAFGHSDNSVRELAENIALCGQKQPVIVRRIEDGKVELVCGYRRFAAVSLVNSDPSLREAAQLNGENLKLNCVLTSANAENAFVDSIVENAHRSATSPVDDAHNIKQLIDVYGWDWERVGKLYTFGLAWAQRLYNRILRLSSKHQKLLHEGKLSLGAAMDLADMPEDERDAAVEAAMQENGKVVTAEVKKAVRNSKQERGKGLGRSVREFRSFFENMKKNEDGSFDEVERRYADDMLRFIKGEIGEQGLLNAIRRLRTVTVTVNAPTPVGANA